LNGKICFADFEIDTAHRLLRRGGETVALNAKAFDLLEFLAKNAGRVVTKNEILDAVWADQFVEEANLKVQVSVLRKALGEHRNEHRFVVTLPGKGYKFVADTRIANGDVVIEKHRVSHIVVEEETEISDLATDVYTSQANRSSRMMPLAGALVLILTIAGGFWLLSFRRDSSSNALAAAPDVVMKRLTNNGRVNRVKLSPDSKFFAYTLRQRSSFETELRVGQTDGSSDILLRSVAGMSQYPIAFSSDGNWVYYVEIPAVSEYKNPTGGFYKTPILPGVPQKLADSVSVFSVISPNEKQIASPERNSDRTSSIMVADLDGSNEREIPVRPADDLVDLESLTWSADGRSIAFSAETGNSKKDPSKRSAEAFVVRLEDGSVSQLTSLDWNRVLLLDWLKDGAGLVAVARDSQQLNTSSLWLISYPGGNVERISRDVNRYAGTLSVSADSKTLAVVQSVIESNLWRAPNDDLAQISQVTYSSSGRQDGWHGMDWTPDGRLVVTAWLDESLTLWTMDADGKNARQITPIGFRDEKPAVSPDGKHIVFQSNRSGASAIWRMNIDGSNLQQLTPVGSADPSITPDGLWVVYGRTLDGNNSLWRIPFAGGEAQQLTDKDIDNPRVSPDGRFVACTGNFDKRPGVAIFPIEGGEPVKLFAVPETANFRYGGLRWSPDGHSVSYPDEANGIWLQDIRGGEPRRLEGSPPEATFSYAWSTDGKQLAFGRQREVRDAILISNFR
jgi:Tol biopolymer transport system component/DNA-binding winged helix-turn-helix (wHTH) protein